MSDSHIVAYKRHGEVKHIQTFNASQNAMRDLLRMMNQQIKSTRYLDALVLPVLLFRKLVLK
eukprot:scaffold605593_cov23-Prasinocladus_malaysianus.AAC.1